MKREIRRHKNCNGFILPDIENSFTGMLFGYCPKCGKNKLTIADFDITEENTTLYVICNKNTGEYLMIYNDDRSFTIEFESEQQANEFADHNGITDYEIKPNVALYCDEAQVTNGKMIINKGEE